MRLTFPRVTVLGLALCLTACHKKVGLKTPPPAGPHPAVLALEEGDRAFAASDWARAAIRYDEYLRLSPSGNQRDRVLFNRAIIYSVSGTPEYDPNRSVSLLKVVIAKYPLSPVKPAAAVILGLLDEIAQLAANRQETNQRIEQLRAKLALAQQEQDSKPAVEDIVLSAANCAKAVPTLESDLRQAGAQRALTLFKLAGCYGSPEYSRHNWERASGFCKQLVTQHADNPLAQMCRNLEPLWSEIAQLSSDAEKQNQKIRQLSDDLDRLKAIDSQRPRRP